MSHNWFVRLRLQRGLTQEQLAERSGISVRTIRNFERGLVDRPRRSSVDMLLAALDPGTEQLRTARLDEQCLPSGLAAELLQPVDPDGWVWRGPRPPRTPLIGREQDVEQLGRLVMAHRTVVVTGAGGVGKSRMALTVAESVGRMFSHGVSVVDMGRIPGEQHRDSQYVMDMAVTAVDALFAGDEPQHGRHALLVLDNIEHLTRVAAVLVDRLINDHPALHILITSRRPPVVPDARICELPLLSRKAATDLLINRLWTSCPVVTISSQDPRLAELVEKIDRLPRFVEFAAHRLRVVPLSMLLSDRHAIKLLSSTDCSILPHQQTLESNVRWSLDLLDERHWRLLTRLAQHLDSFSELVLGQGEFAQPESVELLADLVDASLLQVERGRRYEYRMLRHVQAVIADDPEPIGERKALEPVTV